MDLRPLCQSSPIRGQLEVDAYGRDALLEKLSQPVRSLPLFAFIDGLGLYRNMYRSLMGFYFINAGLSYIERARRTNVLPLTLGPHGSNMKDVVNAIGPSNSPFEEGTVMSIDGLPTEMFAFTCAFTGNMPQQRQNSGMLNQRANFGCRSCFAEKKDRGNLDYNIISCGRYHYQTMAIKDYMRTLTASKRPAYSKATGISDETEIPLQQLCPALDLILSRPADPAHSEFNGISHSPHALLLENILPLDTQIEYCNVLRRCPFSPEWAHPQNSRRHLGNYRLSEHGRWSIKIPILLRTWLKDGHNKPFFVEAVRETFWFSGT